MQVIDLTCSSDLAALMPQKVRLRHGDRQDLIISPI